MTKRDFLEYCRRTHGVSPDNPFGRNSNSLVLRHTDDRKWYALVMNVSRRKFGQDSDDAIDVVNLKLPLEIFGTFGASDGIYPAYHMNKLHWVSVLLPDVKDELLQFLVNVSFDITKSKQGK